MAKARANIPQQHREILRCNMRFDRRDDRDVKILKLLANPDLRAKRLKELIELGFEARENIRSLRAGRSPNPPINGEQ